MQVDINILDVGKHAIFGRVQSGIGIVQRIGLVNTGNDDRYVAVS